MKPLEAKNQSNMNAFGSKRESFIYDDLNQLKKRNLDFLLKQKSDLKSISINQFQLDFLQYFSFSFTVQNDILFMQTFIVSHLNMCA